MQEEIGVLLAIVQDLGRTHTPSRLRNFVVYFLRSDISRFAFSSDFHIRSAFQKQSVREVPLHYMVSGLLIRNIVARLPLCCMLCSY